MSALLQGIWRRGEVGYGRRGRERELETAARGGMGDGGSRWIKVVCDSWRWFAIVGGSFRRAIQPNPGASNLRRVCYLQGGQAYASRYMGWLGAIQPNPGGSRLFFAVVAGREGAIWADLSGSDLGRVCQLRGRQADARRYAGRSE